MCAWCAMPEIYVRFLIIQVGELTDLISNQNTNKYHLVWTVGAVPSMHFNCNFNCNFVYTIYMYTIHLHI